MINMYYTFVIFCKNISIAYKKRKNNTFRNVDYNKACVIYRTFPAYISTYTRTSQC